MNVLDAGCPFPNGGGHSLDAATAHIAYGKDSGNTRLEHSGSPLLRVISERAQTLPGYAGPNELLLIQIDTAGQPTCIGYGTRHQKDMPDLMPLDHAIGAGPPGHTRQSWLACQGDELGR